MIINEFIPFSMSALFNYLYKKFNINIKDIPIEDFKSLIYYKYCKNILNDEVCIRPCKKIKKDKVYYYTDIDNLGDNKIQFQNLKSEKNLLFNSYDTNKNNEKKKYITLGSFNIKIKNNIYFSNSLFNNINIVEKENNKNLNSIFDNNDNKDYIKNTFTFSNDSIQIEQLSDLYYIFTYLIYVIFNFSDIGIDYYISQYILRSNNIFDY
jgi:hypothetical protein